MSYLKTDRGGKTLSFLIMIFLVFLPAGSRPDLLEKEDGSGKIHRSDESPGSRSNWGFGSAVLAAEEASEASYYPDGRMVYFAATGSATRNMVTIQWETRTEPWTSGYFVWRSEKKDGSYFRIHHGMILARGGDTFGGFYTIDDYGVVSGKTYYYKVQEIEESGFDRFYGPVASDGSIDWDKCCDKDRVNISCFIDSLLL